jgi:hypothetical protein
MKKEKTETINLAARMMAEARWRGVPPEERKEHQRKAARVPRTAKRCFCGATGMTTAAQRYFDCCRRAGVITLNLHARKTAGEKPQPVPEVPEVQD